MDFQKALSRAASGKHGKILIVRETESNTLTRVLIDCTPSVLELISQNFRILRRALPEDYDLTQHLCAVAMSSSMICSELCISSEWGALSLRELDYDPTNTNNKGGRHGIRS